MKIESTRLIAIFDLDGVLVENPPESLGNGPPITDSHYWEKHWLNPQAARLQTEMVEMAASLIGANWQVIVLTARPAFYRPATVELLRRMEIRVSETPRERISSSYGRPVLHMLPGGDVPLSSAAWKQETVREWKKQGARIQFMVEDYRGNAEAIRAVVPVLLYERRKYSQYLAVHPCCGGLARCWCNLSGPSGAQS